MRQAVRTFYPACVLTAHVAQAAGDGQGANLNAILLPTTGTGIPAALEHLDAAQKELGHPEPVPFILGVDLRAAQVQSVLTQAAASETKGMLVVISTVPVQEERLDDVDVAFLAQATWSDRALASCARLAIGGRPFRIPGLPQPHVLLVAGFPLRPFRQRLVEAPLWRLSLPPDMIEGHSLRVTAQASRNEEAVARIAMAVAKASETGISLQWDSRLVRPGEASRHH